MDTPTPQEQAPVQTRPEPKKPSTSKQDYTLAALAYVPGVFIITAFQKGKDPFFMSHAKMGALTTLIFIFPFLITSFLNIIIGFLLYFLYFIFLGFGFYKAWIGQKFIVPLLSQVANKIPLEALVKDLSDAGKQVKDAQDAKTQQAPAKTQASPVQTSPEAHTVEEPVPTTKQETPAQKPTQDIEQPQQQ